MARGIDHLVLPVRDLDAARATYERLGFTLTPTAKHPWGTSNALVQMDGNFLELLAVTDPELIRQPKSGEISFGAFNMDFAERHEGFSMLVLESAGPDVDRAEYLAAGMQVHAPFSFERQAKQPDGSTATVGFSLTIASHEDMPNAGFFTCHQHNPAAFWKPDYQVHANGAEVIGGVTMVTDDPQQFSSFFADFSGSNTVTSSASAVDVSTPRGRLSVVTSAEFVTRHDIPVTDAVSLPAFCAYTITVKDLEATTALFAGNGVEHIRHDGRIIIPPSSAHGVTLAFEANSGH